MRRLITLSCIPGLLLATCLTFAADYYVDVNTGSNNSTGRSPDDAWRTITHAMSLAKGTEQDPSVIHIASGVYSVSTGETFPINIGYSDTSLLRTGPSEVVIDAEQTGLVLYCEAWSGVLSGLTITGGYSTRGLGGGVEVSGRVRLENCVILGNVGRLGGGIGLGIYQDTELLDCVIENNQALSTGGGIYQPAGSLTLVRCHISGNSAWLGAGIHVFGGKMQLVDSVVADNIAEDEDGTVTSDWNFGAGLAVTDLGAYGRSELDVTNSLFLSNVSRDGLGGAAFIELSREGIVATFSGCTFFGNAARDAGPALCVEIYRFPGYKYSLPAVEVTDCVFRDGGDEISEEEPGLVVVENSCVEGGWDGEGASNFDADPLFVTGPLGDYYLSQTAAGQGEESGVDDGG